MLCNGMFILQTFSVRHNGVLGKNITSFLCSGCIASVPERNVDKKKNLNVMHFNIELISKGMSVSCSEDNTALMYAWHMKMIMEIRVWALSCIFSWNVIQLLLKTHVIQHLC